MSKQTLIENQAIFWLAKLNSSNVTQEQEEEFFAWLNKSPLHQAAYIKAEDLWERGDVLQRLPEKAKGDLRDQWQGWAAACASLVLVVFAFFFVTADKSTHYEYQTAVGEQKDVQLEDGSHLTLNTNSKIHLSLNSKSRTATLVQGEIFFDVAADKSRPFDVMTKSGVVRVVGTHFSIRELADDTLVTVIEGRVALGHHKNDEKEFVPTALLQANQRLNFNGLKTGAVPENLDAARELSWRNKQLIYKGRLLGDVIADLNRYFPVVITLADPSLSSHEITAVIRLTDLHTTLQALTQPLGLSVDVDPAGTKVTLRAGLTPN